MGSLQWMGANRLWAQSSGVDAALLPEGWNAKMEGDRVMSRLISVTHPKVKGAHDAEFVVVEGKAYIVAEANDEKAGENAAWPTIYVTLSIVDISSMKVLEQVDFARGGQAFANMTLPEGACFVPRIFQKDAKTLRCYFASEAPGKRQSKTWYLDYDLTKKAFVDHLGEVKLKTSKGILSFEPRHFYEDAVHQGFTHKPVDFGIYIFDSFKQFDGQWYVALNNFPGAQNALAKMNAEADTFEVLGHYNQPQNLRLTESSVNRLPDGSWMAICRQESGTRNYMFTTSRDGKNWTVNETRDFVPNGTNSKPTFDHFNGIYYLGWQESTQIDGANRSVFNVDVSKDGRHWVRKYRFESTNSFQYPTFHLYEGSIYVSLTQGEHDASRKERIMFGKLE